jgi:CRISPR-associated protein Cas2
VCWRCHLPWKNGNPIEGSVVSYDVSDPKRLRKVFKALRGYGDHLQLSVFRCELSARERVELGAIIHHKEDQVLFVCVGPADGRAATAFSTLGRPYEEAERVAIVV